MLFARAAKVIAKIMAHRLLTDKVLRTKTTEQMRIEGLFYDTDCIGSTFPIDDALAAQQVEISWSREVHSQTLDESSVVDFKVSVSDFCRKYKLNWGWTDDTTRKVNATLDCIARHEDTDALQVGTLACVSFPTASFAVDLRAVLEAIPVGADLDVSSKVIEVLERGSAQYFTTSFHSVLHNECILETGLWGYFYF